MNGRVAVVTGAGGGIGSAISQRLAEAGASVVLTYRKSAEKTQAVAESLVGNRHLVVQAPADDSHAQKRLAEQIAERCGSHVIETSLWYRLQGCIKGSNVIS